MFFQNQKSHVLLIETHGRVVKVSVLSKLISCLILSLSLPVVFRPDLPQRVGLVCSLTSPCSSPQPQISPLSLPGERRKLTQGNLNLLRFKVIASVEQRFRCWVLHGTCLYGDLEVFWELWRGPCSSQSSEMHALLLYHQYYISKLLNAGVPVIQ